MDELENPDISAAGREVAAQVGSEMHVTSAPEEVAFNKPGMDTAEHLGLDPEDMDEGLPIIDPAEIEREREEIDRELAALQQGIDPETAPQTDRPEPPKRAGSQRPVLKRESSAPAPPQPPPAAPSQSAEPHEYGPQDTQDSLTLAELKRIRSNFPNAPNIRQEILPLKQIYDFEYEDAQTFPVEIEEWFSYSESERNKLRTVQETFNKAWNADPNVRHVDWADADGWDETRDNFVKKQIVILREGTSSARSKALQCLVYVALGVWEKTAGRANRRPKFDWPFFGSHRDQSGMQLACMVENVKQLMRADAVPAVWDTLRAVADGDLRDAERIRDKDQSPTVTFREGDESLELWCAFTLMYVFLELARTVPKESKGTLHRDVLGLGSRISALQPSLLVTLTELIARLRWHEAAPLPQTKMLLLAWKAILVCLGGITEVDTVKNAFRETEEEKDKRGQPVITASPLDYHLFRQELNSKYPAYQPPPPIFPLEPDNNSILPPLQHRRPKYEVSDANVAGSGVNGASIMHQATHIATPAPSPPPSPGGPGGKGGKKQNYQTNQMFPFLYPPLDVTSNNLGGKGSTELQDALVGRKWEGSDIPSSILEAAELFAKRMRATRAMKQLWQTRVDFMRYERGWKMGYNDAEIEALELEPEEQKEQKEQEDFHVPKLSRDIEKKLTAVGDFYRDSLPHLQSVVIVLLKAVLKNVGDLVAASGNRNGLQAGFQEANGVPHFATFDGNGNGHIADGSASTAEQVDTQRAQEITGKALSGMLLLMLKWFKVYHILSYEYLTQLLLDSNYVPLILRLWQSQDIGRACHFKLEREELNFFSFCRTDPRNPQAADSDHESDDDAVPPPIKLRRDTSESAVSSNSPSENNYSHPPEVDELGYPQTLLPSSPIRTYSFRNIFTFTNYLRILQKITRRKTHRSLLLVSYKSSNHLKKSLRVPVEIMRYYTLKLFKSQVPYCGRKWRQGNMKIITAVWLSVPAELRDDWLQGGGGGMGGAGPGDVDGTVEEALPLEQSLRSLTHWWNVKTYPDKMGVEKEKLSEEEYDFFVKELEKMEVGRGEEELSEDALAEEAWTGGRRGPIEGY